MKRKIFLAILACILVLSFAACGGGQKTPELVIEGKTATTITVKAVEGAEYSKDGGTKWQDNNVFEGLTPATTYSITIRMKESGKDSASKAATAIQVTTLAKGTQTAPALVATKTATTITVTAVTGAEYRIGSTGNWQTSNVFEGLTPNTEYTVAIRLAETTLLAASPSTEEKVTTNAAAPLAAPADFAFDEETKAFTWGAVTNASKYIVTVDVAEDGIGSENTIVRLLSSNYEIEVTGTSLPVSRLPYDCDLSLTVRATSTSAEFTDSAETEAEEINRGSIFVAASTKIELALNGENNVYYFAQVQLVQDLVIPVREQGQYTREDAEEAYANLFNGEGDQQELANSIGNDLIFAIYEDGVELTAENVFAKNKFWSNMYVKEDESKVPGTIGLTGYTFSKDEYFRTSSTFSSAANSYIDVNDMYGKDIVTEIGVLLDGVYYAYTITVTIPSVA